MEDAVNSMNWVVGVIVAVAGILMAIDHILTITHKYSPTKRLVDKDKEIDQKLSQHDELLRRDLEHLQKHDKEISSLSASLNGVQHSFFGYQSLTLEALLCVLSKNVTDEELKTVEDKIKKYLISRH